MERVVERGRGGNGRMEVCRLLSTFPTGRRPRQEMVAIIETNWRVFSLSQRASGDEVEREPHTHTHTLSPVRHAWLLKDQVFRPTAFQNPLLTMGQGSPSTFFFSFFLYFSILHCWLTESPGRGQRRKKKKRYKKKKIERKKCTQRHSQSCCPGNWRGRGTLNNEAGFFFKCC